MKPSIKTDVLIIGGGPAGMISAIYLDQLGISTVLVERQFEISKHPKAHELSARSIEILTQLGISIEELQAEASSYQDASRILFCHSINTVLGEIDLKKGGNDAKYKQHLAAPDPYLNLSQTELEKILRRKLDSCVNNTSLIGHQWEGMNEEENAVHSTIIDRHTNERFNVESTYLICADGAGSRSRKALGIAMDGADKIEDFISVYFELNLRDHLKQTAKLFWIMHPEAPGTFIAHHIEKRWVYHFPIYTPYEKREDFTKELLKDRILTALGDKSIPLEIESISFWRMTCQIATAFRKGKAFLVGDAAHRFPPTGGLGMNSGIGDVQNLCWKLALVLKGIASDTLLDSYEMERRPVIELNSAESMRNFRKIWEVPEAMGLNPKAMLWQARLVNNRIFKTLPKPWTDGLLKRLYKIVSKQVLSILEKPKLQAKVHKAIEDQTEHFDRIGLDLGYAYKAGALIPGANEALPRQTVSEYQPSIESGVRFPHFWFTEEGNRKSSHSWLCTQNFTLLCNKEGADWWNIQSLKLPKQILDIIRVQNIQEILQGQPDDAPERAYYPIDMVPLLLIRPDGQIAWKPSNLNTSLSSIFNQLIPQ